MSDLIAQIEAEVWRRGGRQRGDEIEFRCPVPDSHTHGDQHPSASWNRTKRVWNCQRCGAKGGYVHLAKALGIDLDQPERPIAIYEYRDADGTLSFEVVKYPGKRFTQRRPDGKGGYTYKTGDLDLLYRLPEVLAADHAWFILVVEGEKDADRAWELGFPATTNPGGAGKWRDAHGELLRGWDVCIIPDNDDPGREHAHAVAASLLAHGAQPHLVELDDLPPKGDLSDWLDAGHGSSELAELITHATPASTSPPPKEEARWRRFVDDGLELTGDVVAAMPAAGMEPPTLPLLGLPGLVMEGWSHLWCGYPRVGKTELIARAVREWLDEQPDRPILYITEEPVVMWARRLHLVGGEWRNLRLVFGLGIEPDDLKARAVGGDEPIIIIDACRNLLRLQDENNNSEIARVLNPWVAGARATTKTLVALHHNRKGGGEGGEGIAGGHAFLGVVDVALEIMRDRHHKNRRIIRPYARLVSPPELLYEMAADGTMRALGDPGEIAFQAVEDRLLDELTEEPRTTNEIRLALDDPKPSSEQVRRALTALAYAGRCRRYPDINVGVAPGKTLRWSSAGFVPGDTTSNEASSKEEGGGGASSSGQNGAYTQEEIDDLMDQAHL